MKTLETCKMKVGIWKCLARKKKKELISNVQFYGMRRFPLRHCALFMGAQYTHAVKSNKK